MEMRGVMDGREMTGVEMEIESSVTGDGDRWICAWVRGIRFRSFKLRGIDHVLMGRDERDKAWVLRD